MTAELISDTLNDLEMAKEFIGSIIMVREYGDGAYEAILRSMKTIENWGRTEPRINTN